MPETTITPPSIEEGNRRLLVLADFLDTVVDPPHFYMGWIYNVIAKEDRDWVRRYEKTKHIDCGSVACMVGWSPSVPEFQALGLRLDKVRGDVYLESNKGDGLDSFETAELFFGLDTDQVDSLFGGHLSETIRTPRQGAEHLRKFVRKRQKNAPETLQTPSDDK